MVHILYDKYSELIDDLLDILDKEQNVSIFCDYELANELLQNIDFKSYEDFVVELDEDIDEYYVGKCQNAFIGFEKARATSGKLKIVEADTIIIVEDAVKDFDEVFDAVSPLECLLNMTYDRYDLEEDLEDIDECDCECTESDCEYCQECDECESHDFGYAITDRINSVMELFDNPSTCDDCKFEALMDLVLLGVDGALQGCIGRKEE